MPAAALSPCPSDSSSVSPTTWTPFSYRVRVSLRYPFLLLPYPSSLRHRFAHVPSLGRLLLLLSRVCCQLDALEFSFDSPRPSLPSRRPTQQTKFAWSRSSGRSTLQANYPQKELNLPSVLVFLGPSLSRFDPLSPELFSPPLALQPNSTFSPPTRSALSYRSGSAPPCQLRLLNLVVPWRFSACGRSFAGSPRSQQSIPSRSSSSRSSS